METLEIYLPVEVLQLGSNYDKILYKGKKYTVNEYNKLIKKEKAGK